MLRIVSTVGVWLVLLLLPNQNSLGFSELEGFFAEHCYDCHDDSLSKGDLDLTILSTNLTDPKNFAKWERIFDRVSNGEMPPPKKAQPKPGEISQFRNTLAKPLLQAHQAKKGTVLRRLNRKEYHNTLNDLFGTHVDLASLLPEDGRSHEFDNVGKALGISMVQMQRYLEGIRAVLKQAVLEEPKAPNVETLTADYVNTTEGKRHIPNAWGKAPDGAVLFFRRIGYPTGMLRGTGVKEDGYYKVRVTGYAYNSKQPITFSVGGTSFVRGSEKPTYGYHSFSPGKPQTIEFTQLIRAKHMIDIKPWGLTDQSNYIRDKRTTEGYTGPALAINRVEVEGPIFKQHPPAGHQLVIGGLKQELINPGKRYPVYRLRSDEPVKHVTHILLNVAEKAFRRPVTEEDLKPYIELFKKEFTEPDLLEDSLYAAISAIFLSPDFLYLKEGKGFLNDYELASRLSYAFNRSTPDALLLKAAADGKLATDPNELWRQSERLMKSEKFDRFIEDFCDAWLNLREIDFTAPDKDLYPEYDQHLQYSMLSETRAFLRALIDENLSVKNIVKSDFAMLNNRLAEHYGISGVAGPEIRKHSIYNGSNRGGFITQASVLKVSANGTNTSPVLRGVWMMERILGQTPAPPPPGIAGVEPDIRGAETLRELLDKHRDSSSCQACHQAIDPPGFALESFNPIGGWRDNFRSLGEGEKVYLEINGRKIRYKIGQPVDSSGTYQGKTFSNFSEFRDLLASDEDQLARAFTTKMLTFFTGREMGFSDRPRINQIVKRSADNGHGIRDLIKSIVFSDIFRKK